jgi:hypothetical protein
LKTRYGLRGKRVATAAAATLADVLDLQASSDRPRRGAFVIAGQVAVSVSRRVIQKEDTAADCV